MTFTNRIYIVSLFLAISELLNADINPVFRHLDIPDGMSDNQIRSLNMTPDKRLSIRSLSGIDLYNSTTFEHFYQDKTKEYKWNFGGLFKEYFDSENRIWMKEHDNLLLLDLNTNRFIYDIEEILSVFGLTIPIKNLFIDESKNYWFIDEGNSFYMFDISTQELNVISPGNEDFVHKNGVPREIVQYKNEYWFVYTNGLIRCWDYSSKKFILEETAFIGAINDATDRLYIHATVNGNIWLMYNHAVVYYDRVRKIWKEITGISGISNFFTCMDLDPNGNVWIGTSRSGLRYIDAGTHQVQKIPGMMLTTGGELVNDIHSVFVDPDGGIWVGTLFQGLCYYHPAMHKFSLVQTIKNPTQVTNETVRAFLEMEDGTLLVGTVNGLYRYDPDTRKPEIAYPELSEELCLSLYRDRQGNIWLGTFHNGLYRISKNGSIRNYVTTEADYEVYTYQNTGRAVYEDRWGSYWVCVYGGVGKLDIETGKIELLKNRFPQLNPYVINYNFYLYDEDVFAVLSESGIYYYDICKDSVWIPDRDYPDNPKFQDPGIRYYCAYKDSREMEWFGTERGLRIWDEKNEKLYRITVDTELPNNSVSAILEDEYGTMWVSTANGISKIEVEEKKDEHVFSLVNFNSSDGLQSGKFYDRSAIRSSNGMLAFGGIHGFNTFFPDKIVYNKSVGKPFFTAFSLFNIPVDENTSYNKRSILKNPIHLSDEITLKYNENFITLEFNGLNYVKPSQTYFRYKLENFDQSWTEITTNGAGKVTYTGLRPGSYRFIVYTGNNDRYWGSEPAVLQLVITPPFWATTTAYILYSLCFVVLIYILIVYLRKKNHRKMLVLQVEQKRKQEEEINRMKERFFTNVSHEFRTPLTLIMTPLDIMIKQNNDPELKDKLKSLYRNASELLNLVNQLLDFRKLETKGEELNLSKGNFTEFIKNIYLQFKDTAISKNISFDIEYEAKGLNNLIMNFDPDKMRKVMYNLLSNAFKFTPEGGRVAIILNTVEENEHRYLEVSVSDTGCGVDTADQERIFERFYRSNTAYEQPGSGIGLHLVKEYVYMHGGKIRLDNSSVRGSIFTVYLPVDLKIEEEDGEVTISSVDNTEGLCNNESKEKSLLVVEDNNEFRHFLVEQLSAFFTVYEAANGKEGEKIALSHLPDLIISDLMMPEMDGLELCTSIKSNLQTSHIPFILLTAKNSDISQMEGYKAGADDYIAKPFNFDLLLIRVHKLIEQQEKRKELFRQNIDISPVHITITSLDEELVKKALQCVEENMSSAEYSVDKLGADIGLSRSHLYRKLYSITGLKPIEFIRSVRLKRAAQLLKESQYNISEIADMVGFNTLKYFNKYFKDTFGKTPSEYRNEKHI